MAECHQCTLMQRVSWESMRIDAKFSARKSAIEAAESFLSVSRWRRFISEKPVRKRTVLELLKAGDSAAIRCGRIR